MSSQRQIHFETLKRVRTTKGVSSLASLTACSLFSSGETHYVREECASEECQAPVLGGPALLFPNSRQALLHLGLYQWRRGELLAELLPEMIEEKGEAQAI